jgi:hypothetical protein
MAVEKRITVGLNGRGPQDLELVQSELKLSTTDAVNKALALLALIARRQSEGFTPAFIRPDGSVQEIYLL